MALMYMYAGLDIPLYSIPSACVPDQCSGRISHLPSPIGREELLVSGYKNLNCPVGVLTDPAAPSHVARGAVTGTHGGEGRVLKPPMPVGRSSPPDGRQDAKEARHPVSLPPPARKDNQLKFGIDRILGNCVSSARERTEKNIFDALETRDRTCTDPVIYEEAPGGQGSEIVGPVIACDGWRSGRVSAETSPCYPIRRPVAGGHAARSRGGELSIKFGRASDFCPSCYQDTCPLVYHSSDLWSFAQYQYRLDRSINHQYPVTKHPQPRVGVPLTPQKPYHTTPALPARLTGRRKRSWSRAVFTNLQRKGLEKRFEIQKYVNKPDRRQLAAALGLTDAQVKVWFQNRRMKWRHVQRTQKQQQAADTSSAAGGGEQSSMADDCSGTDEEGPTVDRSAFPD